MAIEFRCPDCRQKYSIVDDFAGKTVRCRKCEKSLEVPFPPLELPEERSAGGSLIYRHEGGDRDIEVATGDGENIERIADHIEKHLGPVHIVCSSAVCIALCLPNHPSRNFGL
ncbi:MAG: putative Zn finger-like uncharacterized protein [Pirellulaceae bacterium]|jgi:predicted Zn finger-like uncharacterized protein